MILPHFQSYEKPVKPGQAVNQPPRTEGALEFVSECQGYFGLMISHQKLTLGRTESNVSTRLNTLKFLGSLKTMSDSSRSMPLDSLFFWGGGVIY